jgi:hypothetical protein
MIPEHTLRFQTVQCLMDNGFNNKFILQLLSLMPDYNEKMAKFHLKEMRKMK